MYDCSGTDMKRWQTLHVPHYLDTTTTTSPIYQSGWDQSSIPAGPIDFTKYENWLRCMTVSRAAHLIKLLGFEWETVYVLWQNRPNSSLLQTTLASLACKPDFLTSRPRNIWCSFAGGPPGHKTTVKSSVLNFIVDRVYHHFMTYGEEVTDACIIKALNFQEVIYLPDESQHA